MKKKILSTISTILVMILLSSCGNKIPDELSEETYNYGIKVVDATEKYLDADATIRETSDRVDTLYSLMNTLENQKTYDSILCTQTSTLSTCLYLALIHEDVHGSVPEDDIKDIREKLDSIKETLEME